MFSSLVPLIFVCQNYCDAGPISYKRSEKNRAGPYIIHEML
jgi:hypothetical protein